MVAVVPDVGGSSLATGKAKKGVRCWKCSLDTHASIDCKVQHYCYICEKLAHSGV
jgi:hypothetical protein